MLEIAVKTVQGAWLSKGNFPTSLLAYKAISAPSPLKNKCFLTPKGEKEEKEKKIIQLAASQYQRKFIDTESTKTKLLYALFGSPSTWLFQVGDVWRKIT